MLVDTSGLLAFLDSREDRHADAVSLLRSARRPMTHSYILAELLALATARDFSRSIVIEFETVLIASGAVETIWVDAALHRSALDLLARRSDKLYSLCDAVSFVLMRETAMVEALTTDRHFMQEGFRKLL